MATKHMNGMDLGRAIKFLTDAIEYTPKMAELWSNRSHAWEMMHDHEKALADALKAIELSPKWPKAYLRAARALMSLERGAEAAHKLRKALEVRPRDETLLNAYKEAMALAECTRRTERAIKASALPSFNGVGDSDIIDVARGACKKCDCNAYIQKHGRTTVLLLGRGQVRQDNDPSFFLCARCGHDCVSHKDLRELEKEKRSKPRGVARSELPTAPSTYYNPDKVQDTYTNGAAGTRGGLNSGYYYASVGDEQRTAPTQAPPRIDPKQVGAQDGGSGRGAVARDHEAHGGSGYYYASHGRPTDYKVPAVPQKVGGDGKLHAWRPDASRGADRDEWEDECDPSMLRDVDPLAMAGTKGVSNGGAASIDVSDPLAAAAAQNAPSGDGLDAADPLAMCNS